VTPRQTRTRSGMTERRNGTRASVRHKSVACLRVVAVVSVVCVLSACSHPATRRGTVTGRLPLCYGPGPDINLSPTATIETYRSGRLVSTDTFPSSEQHPTYTLSLPAGSYDLHVVRQGDTLHVHVKSGVQTRADWPQPTCL
jgi:hypothetical protein